MYHIVLDYLPVSCERYRLFNTEAIKCVYFNIRITDINYRPMWCPIEAFTNKSSNDNSCDSWHMGGRTNY